MAGFPIRCPSKNSATSFDYGNGCDLRMACWWLRLWLCSRRWYALIHWKSTEAASPTFSEWKPAVAGFGFQICMFSQQIMHKLWPQWPVSPFFAVLPLLREWDIMLHPRICFHLRLYTTSLDCLASQQKRLPYRLPDICQGPFQCLWTVLAGLALLCKFAAKCQHRPKWTVVSRGVNEVKSSGGLVQSPMLQENQILPPMSQLNLSPIASAPTPPWTPATPGGWAARFYPIVFSPDLAICAHSARRTALWKEPEVFRCDAFDHLRRILDGLRPPKMSSATRQQALAVAPFFLAPSLWFSFRERTALPFASVWGAVPTSWLRIAATHHSSAITVVFAVCVGTFCACSKQKWDASSCKCQQKRRRRIFGKLILRGAPILLPLPCHLEKWFSMFWFKAPKH